MNFDDVGAIFNLAAHNTHHFIAVVNNFGVTSSAVIGNHATRSATHCGHERKSARLH